MLAQVVAIDKFPLIGIYGEHLILSIMAISVLLKNCLI